ncbi:subtilisin-like protease SBT4.4 [Rosa rugosa]|uniref:subtilisin-like protease SBT4.4 n=1 Tax=Rosa rugosa TaxID=74645 RepID=UPI002B410775|nr:subtilisin-like protease SBT4.4 [Rosa rugosa]
MAKHGAFLFSYAFSTLVLTMSLLCNAIDHEDRKVHIVYLGSLPDDEEYSPRSHHLDILQRVVDGSSAENCLIRSYQRSFNGFAAKLSDQEKEKTANMKEVVSVFPSRTFQLQTTRSWDFMGLKLTSPRKATAESNIIVAVIDTGIDPDSESFRDEGFGAAPMKWKGVCEGGENFSCNNKIIGARFYDPAESARDEDGHGTHTASTAAGNVVTDVSFYGLEPGTARGGVPSARIAAYKVCGATGCSSEAILAAFDDAIADGVDIVSVSLGSRSPVPFDNDPIAVGSYHAMKKGILTSHSAGNRGPGAGTVTSVAPWMLAVAASSKDRRIIDKAVLGSRTLVGASVNSFILKGSFPLIYGKDASSKCPEYNATNCEDGCLDSNSVRNKIVLCDQPNGVYEADRAGARGTIFYNPIPDDASLFPMPAVGLRSEDYNVAISYTNSTKDPQASISKSENIKDPAAPEVVSFSSRGPNQILPEIIKPDVTGPGVTIIAAYPSDVPVTSGSRDTRRVKYNILSGTSMSCPHATGVAAYVKEFHPDWSPAAIKSALMTTAWPMNDTSNSASPGEFAYGSGHINPLKAIDPGLVYDASAEDYIKLLCLVMDEVRVRLISGDNSTCPTASEQGSAKDLNYPSISAVVTPMTPFTVTVRRRVTNVGLANSTYKAEIMPNSQVDIKVEPQVLSFKSMNEEKTFNLTIAGRGLPDGSHMSSSLVWSDETHKVKSPVLVQSLSAAVASRFH